MDSFVTQSVIEKVFHENPVLSRIRLKADVIKAEYEKARQDLLHLKNMGMLYVNEGFRVTLARQPISKAKNSHPLSLKELARASYALAEAFLLEGVRQGDSWCYSTMGAVACRKGDIAENSDLKRFHYDQAMAWYRWATALESPPSGSGFPAIALENIDASAFSHIGQLYYSGLGGTAPPDPSKALEAFESGTTHNVPSCLYESAVIHMHQGKVAGTEAESTKHFDQAFQRFNALIHTKSKGMVVDRVLIGSAYEQLYLAYKKGHGTKPNEEKANQLRQMAVEIFGEASKAGHLLARYKLAYLSAEDALNSTDLSMHLKAIQLLDHVIAVPNTDYAAEAVTAKQAEAHLWAGRLWAKTNNGFRKACDRFYKAIRYGDDRAAIELAALFYEGDGKKTYPKKARTVLLEHLRNHPDDVLAKRFGEEIRLKEAAESNKSTPNDWFFYADFLHDCFTNPDNNLRESKTRYLDAERWYSKASEAGQTDAMNGLAVLLYTGSDKDDDYATEKSLQLWRTAASQGNAMAACNLTTLIFAYTFEAKEIKAILSVIRQTIQTNPDTSTAAMKLYATGLLELSKSAQLLQEDHRQKKHCLLLETIRSMLDAVSENPLVQAIHDYNGILARLANARLLKDGLIPSNSEEKKRVEIFRLLLQAAGSNLSVDAQLYLHGFDQSIMLIYAQDCARVLVETFKKQFSSYPNAKTCFGKIALKLAQHKIITKHEYLRAEQYLRQIPSTYRLPKFPVFN